MAVIRARGPFLGPNYMLGRAAVGRRGITVPVFTEALAAVRAGAGNCRIFCFGDSTTAGFSASPTVGSAMFAQSYPAVAGPLLATALSVPVGISANIGTKNLAASAFGDGRITTTFTHLNGGAGAFYRALAAAAWTFDPGVSWDTADIYYVRTSTIGFNYQISGGGPITPPSITGTTVPHKITISKAAGADTLTINWAAGDVRLAGVHCYTAATKEVSVFNAGVSGQQASGLTSTGALGGLDWLAFWAPHLAIIDWGINDFFVAKAVSTYKSEMQQIITALRNAGSDVVVKTPVWTNTISTPVQADYIAAARELATENRLPLIDISAAWVSYAAADANGWYSDGAHPNATGYGDVATRVAAAVAALAA
jgi:lysophospholipase L1-like esterase